MLYLDGSYAFYSVDAEKRMGNAENPSMLVLIIPSVPLISLTSNFVDGPLAIEPSASVFHYALTLFEGLKAYRTDAGIVTLFRPDMNMKRMNKSATRIALPVALIRTV
jgi:hypothetical protein